MEENWEVGKRQSADLWVVCLLFKVDMKMLGTTTWESLPGKEFNRKKNQSRQMEGKPTLEYLLLSSWLLSLFIPGVSLAIKFLNQSFLELSRGPWMSGQESLLPEHSGKVPSLKLGGEGGPGKAFCRRRILG